MQRSPQQVISSVNSVSDVLVKISRAHDLAIDALVQNVVKSIIRVVNGSALDPQLTLDSADKVNSGTRVYTIGPIPPCVR